MKKIIKKTNIKNNEGFSLVELLTAIALIGILTSIIMITARFSDTQKNLNLEKNRLQATLRLAQSYSLSIPNTDTDNICGFGVEISPAGDSYEIFYTYEDGSGTTCEDDPFNASAVRDVIGIEASEITASIIPAPPGVIFFEAPYGDVLQDGTITLTSSAGTTDVTVSSLGQIN